MSTKSAKGDAANNKHSAMNEVLNEIFTHGEAIKSLAEGHMALGPNHIKELYRRTDEIQGLLERYGRLNT